MIFLLQWKLIKVYFLNGIFFLVKVIFLLQMRTDKHLFFWWNFLSGKSDFSFAMKTNKCLVQYRSKVSWHLILDPCENRVKNRDSIPDCCVSILDSCKTYQTGRPLFTNNYKGFLFEVICSLLSILNCCENLQSLFKFWAIF